MRKEANFDNTTVEILRNDVTDVGERKRNFDNNIAKRKEKIELWQLNCRNWRIKKKKKRKLNCGKSNATVTRYFTIFLQTVVIASFLLVLVGEQKLGPLHRA